MPQLQSAHGPITHNNTRRLVLSPPASKRRRSIDTTTGLDLVQTVGRGSFGCVLLARKTRTCTTATAPDVYCALKVTRKTRVQGHANQLQHCIDEQRTLRTVADHPFFVTLQGAFQDTLNLYLMFEYVSGGELCTHLRRCGHFSEAKAKFYAAQMVLAIDYLHKRNIVHRDLKPENLLIDATGYLKIADFGFAKQLSDNGDGSRAYSMVGTAEYTAPEVLSGAGYTTSVDWWALGILIFEMVMGHAPFADRVRNRQNIYRKITQCQPVATQSVSGSLARLLCGLIAAEPAHRLGSAGGASEVKCRSWFADVSFDDVESMTATPPYVPPINGTGDATAYAHVAALEACAETVTLVHTSADETETGTVLSPDDFAGFDMVSSSTSSIKCSVI